MTRKTTIMTVPDTTKQKPRIEVLSPDNADCFEWMSVGWYTEEQRGQDIHDTLFRLAKSCIRKADDSAHAIRLLKEAGFEVVRWSDENGYVAL